MNVDAENRRADEAALIFPHQLFSRHPVLRKQPGFVFLIDDPLFYGDKQYPIQFHRQKLGYHRATSKAYAAQLEKRGIPLTRWPEAGSDAADDGQLQLHKLFARLGKLGIHTVHVCDPHDWALSQRLQRAAEQSSIKLNVLDTPMFLNTPEQNRAWRSQRKRWFQADFYTWQRQRLDVLMVDDEPVGERWSFDEDNRKKIPNRELSQIPPLSRPRTSATIKSAQTYAQSLPDTHPGRLDDWYYPTTHRAASTWLDQFLEQRFERFGDRKSVV